MSLSLPSPPSSRVRPRDLATERLQGKVIAGRGIGRSLGFPTANLDCPEPVVVDSGVYTATAVSRGQPYHALLVIGAIPNLSCPSIEVHLLDCSADLYGQELTCEIGQKISEIERFDSDEELIAKIKADIATAREVFLNRS